MENLEELIERMRSYRMSEEEQKKQRISFAYGNVAIENPRITIEMVERAAEKLEQTT